MLATPNWNDGEMNSLSLAATYSQMSLSSVLSSSEGGFPSGLARMGETIVKENIRAHIINIVIYMHEAEARVARSSFFHFEILDR